MMMTSHTNCGCLNDHGAQEVSGCTQTSLARSKYAQNEGSTRTWLEGQGLLKSPMLLKDGCGPEKVGRNSKEMAEGWCRLGGHGADPGKSILGTDEVTLLPSPGKMWQEPQRAPTKGETGTWAGSLRSRLGGGSDKAKRNKNSCGSRKSSRHSGTGASWEKHHCLENPGGQLATGQLGYRGVKEHKGENGITKQVRGT